MDGVIRLHETTHIFLLLARCADDEVIGKMGTACSTHGSEEESVQFFR
jgi:hypothetical protein